jgi:hypothetical protein
VVAFIFSLIALVIAVIIPMRYAKRRPVGTPLTWGEAMVAALYVFFVMFLAWGIMPHQWLSYADNALQWRRDKIGIPAGPFGHFLFHGANNDIIGAKTNVFFPNGVPLTNGHLIITAEAARDVVAVLLYGVTLVAMGTLWVTWQRRSDEKPKELPVSAYGRPLVKKA